MSIDQIFLRKLGFLDKILSKKTILSISNKVYEDLKASKARQTSPLTKKGFGRERVISFASRAFLVIGDFYLAFTFLYV